jgi:outer membrane protein OmpA-like peptidoglycan-associated protein
MKPHHLHAAIFGLTLLLATTGAAQAEIGFAMHGEGTAARMVGEDKVDQFGWGAGGLVAPELTLGHHVGFELALGALVLSDGANDEPGMVASEAGYGVFALPGVRVRPFGRDSDAGILSAGGLWLAGGAGVAYTGDAARPALAVRAGYDLFASELFRGGPSAGYLQIIDTTSLVRPEDARIVLFGIHGAFEPQPTKAASDDGDRDRDTIRDGIDLCPDDPEDRDGFDDLDGCPDLDNDGDGLLDRDDDCPNQAEDRDGFEDDDGCPDFDNDGDGIRDPKDSCPLVAEDLDGFEDDDGCPDFDNDGDGIVDGDDKCPDEDETFNDYADDDGCPDTVLVRVVGDEILLDERVYFNVNVADVALRSWPLLNSVADLLKANPRYALVRVQGHADDTGEASWNAALSERRSHAVRDMLIRHGVEASRLVVEGFGDARPQEDEPSVYARRQNRRVEFLILRRGGPITDSEAPR